MRQKRRLIVVGAGPGGLAAAISAKKSGIEDIVVIEREDKVGGILNQCIHDGFGLIRYDEALTGPEYASRMKREAENHGIEICVNTMVIDLNADRVLTICSAKGLREIQAESIIFATGCRERTRGNILIPGTRPAGIYTAGVAQNLINVRNIMPGKRVVILGSGDIGLIMARRLTLEGAEVVAVFEMQSNTSGLERNICQCLFDFHIPLLLNHTITKINGDKRIESVIVSQVDMFGEVIEGTEKAYECDTLILSVGLIPENEILKRAGVEIDEKTKGACVNEYLQTMISGVFVCGNSRKVLDLADIVSYEGELAGRNAASFIKGESLEINRECFRNKLPKGVPEKGIITCIICPRGCHIKAEMDSTGAPFFTGYSCPRGLEYANQELKHPQRVLTSTIKMKDGSLIPIKSEERIAQEDLLSIAERIRKVTIDCTSYCCGERISIDNISHNFVCGVDV